MISDRNALLMRVREAASTAHVIRLRPSRFAQTSTRNATMAPMPHRSAPWTWDDDETAAFERNKAQLTRRLFSAGYLEF